MRAPTKAIFLKDSAKPFSMRSQEKDQATLFTIFFCVKSYDSEKKQKVKARR
jgi:hypothetical protein